MKGVEMVDIIKEEAREGPKFIRKRWRSNPTTTFYIGVAVGIAGHMLGRALAILVRHYMG